MQNWWLPLRFTSPQRRSEMHKCEMVGSFRIRFSFDASKPGNA